MKLENNKTYSFLVECFHTTEHCKKMLYGDETYTFKTKDFDEFTVTDKNNDSFVLTNLAEIADNIKVVKADKEVIEKLLKKDYWAKFEGIKMYADLGIEYGLVNRVNTDEETVEYFEEKAHFLENFETESYEFGDNDNIAEYEYADNFVNEDNEYFCYVIRVNLDTMELHSAERKYSYTWDTVEANFSDEQIKVILEKAAREFQPYIESQKYTQTAKENKTIER